MLMAGRVCAPSDSTAVAREETTKLSSRPDLRGCTPKHLGLPCVLGRELYRVPEAVFVGVGEEEFPGLAGVGGFVEAGLVAGAGGHDDGGVFVEGLDAAEVEFFGAGGDGAGLPEVAAVFGAEDGAVGAAGPGDSAAYVVDAA